MASIANALQSKTLRKLLVAEQAEFITHYRKIEQIMRGAKGVLGRSVGEALVGWFKEDPRKQGFALD